MAQQNTKTEFEKLPKNEQDFRWALFLESNGYEKNLSKRRVKEISEIYKVKI
jgi:hypothetical protein